MLVVGAGEVKEIKIPAVGESITEVTISKWLKKDGDQVAMDEVLCELESDKATFELPAEAAGTLRIIAQEGETVPVGAVICNIEAGRCCGAAAMHRQLHLPRNQQAQAATPQLVVLRLMLLVHLRRQPVKY